MANNKHLELLTISVPKWNEWRKEHPRVTPNLSGADLSKADLVEADLVEADLGGAILSETFLREADLSKADLSETYLSGADLRGATLRRADLSGADLHGAILSRADFHGANFHGANLSEADLSEAYLGGADLSGADLRGANLGGTNLNRADLSGADLSGADLSGAYLAGTIIADVDLSKTKGLENVKHFGPSTIGVDTLYKSRGQIPRVFLIGCGLPDEFITYIDSLIVGKAIQFYSAFISYSSKDEVFARRLHADLQANQVRVWFAPEDLKIGDKFRTAIDEAIRVYDKLIVVLSDTSVVSDWVEKEVEAAFEKERDEKRTVLFPIRIDEKVMKTKQAWAADIRRTRHIGDFTKWANPFMYQNQMNRLLRDLQAANKRGNNGE